MPTRRPTPPRGSRAAQVRLFAAADRAAVGVDAAVRAWWRGLLAALRDPAGFAARNHRALAALRALPLVIAGALRDRLSGLVLLGHGEAAKVLGRAVGNADDTLYRRLANRLVEARVAVPVPLRRRQRRPAGKLEPPPGRLPLQLTEDEGAPDALVDLFLAPSADWVRTVLAPFVRPADWRQIGTDAHKRMPEDLAAQIAASMAAGKTHREVAKDIQPLLDGSRVRAVRAARTFGLHAAHAGQRAAWDQAGDLIIGFEVMATLDGRTRPEHRRRHGTKYYKDPRPGQKGLDEMPRPPLEADGSIAWNCRCALIPLLAGTEPAAPPPPPEPNITARYIDRPGAADQKRLEKLIGARPDPARLAALAGARPGDDVRVSVNVFGPDEAQIGTVGPGYAATRTLKRTARGLVLRNDQISTEAQGTGRGVGTDLFARQVDAAAAAGVVEIQARAARTGGQVGYRVLPLWGYDGPLPREYRDRLPPHLAGAETVQQLYALPGGRAWWEQHGGDVHLTFDPTPGSPSRARLDAYRAARPPI